MLNRIVSEESLVVLAVLRKFAMDHYVMVESTERSEGHTVHTLQQMHDFSMKWASLEDFAEEKGVEDVGRVAPELP
jgi:hypothetical protein